LFHFPTADVLRTNLSCRSDAGSASDGRDKEMPVVGGELQLNKTLMSTNFSFFFLLYMYEKLEL
jgi:hypothetical protein